MRASEPWDCGPEIILLLVLKALLSLKAASPEAIWRAKGGPTGWSTIARSQRIPQQPGIPSLLLGETSGFAESRLSVSGAPFVADVRTAGVAVPTARHAEQTSAPGIGVTKGKPEACVRTGVRESEVTNMSDEVGERSAPDPAEQREDRAR
jgi:hypothetical protein